MSEAKRLSPEPTVHPTAELRDSRLGAWTEIGARSSIAETEFGDYSYVAGDAEIIYSRIGKFCSIASHARINPGNHPLERAALHHFSYRSFQYALGDDDDGFFDWRRGFPVTIGHDVWIGHAAVVMPGVTIGTGAVIGAGAVVTKDVEPFTVAIGVPASPLRKRFNNRVIEGLQRIAWWDWSHQQIQQCLPDFRALGAEDFVNKYDCGR